jgi:hypothetical protein
MEPMAPGSGLRSFKEASLMKHYHHAPQAYKKPSWAYHPMNGVVNTF